MIKIINGTKVCDNGSGIPGRAADNGVVHSVSIKKDTFQIKWDSGYAPRNLYRYSAYQGEHDNRYTWTFRNTKRTVVIKQS